MKPLLEQCGYGVLKPGSPGNIDTEVRLNYAAVISLALISDIGATGEDMTANIHLVNPKMPLIFASLLQFERAGSTISILMDKLSLTSQVVGVSKLDSMTSSNLLSVLYLAKEDFSDSAKG